MNGVDNPNNAIQRDQEKSPKRKACDIKCT